MLFCLDVLAGCRPVILLCVCTFLCKCSRSYCHVCLHFPVSVFSVILPCMFALSCVSVLSYCHVILPCMFALSCVSVLRHIAMFVCTFLCQCSPSYCHVCLHFPVSVFSVILPSMFALSCVGVLRHIAMYVCTFLCQCSPSYCHVCLHFPVSVFSVILPLYAAAERCPLQNGCVFKQSLFTFMKIWTIKIII